MAPATISQCGYSIDEKAFVIPLATGSQCANVPDVRAFPPEQPSLPPSPFSSEPAHAIANQLLVTAWDAVEPDGDILRAFD
jgi:hypothetical protein